MKSSEEKIALAKIVGKELLFPEANRFEDLFPGLFPNRESAPVNLQTWRGDSNRWSNINSYCYRDSRPIGKTIGILYVAPTDKVLNAILDSDVVGGTKYFQIVDRGNNESLVLVKWDAIIASRWIAFIETDSIPEGTS